MKADIVHMPIDAVESLAVVDLFLYYLLSMTWIYRLTLVVTGLGLAITSMEVGKNSLFALLDISKD